VENLNMKNKPSTLAKEILIGYNFRVFLPFHRVFPSGGVGDLFLLREFRMRSL